MQFMPGGIVAHRTPTANFTLNSVTPGEYSLQVQSGGAIITTAGGKP